MERHVFKPVAVLILCVGALGAAAPGAAPNARPEDGTAGGPRAPYASTYVAREAPDTLIRGIDVYTGTGATLRGIDVLLEDGRIAAVGPDLADDGVVLIDGAGRWLTPGLIDVHSHLGDYPAPDLVATRDGNEATAPNTAQVWAEHSVWPQDPQFALALAGGVTTLQILPGSANLFGGRGVTLKNVPARTVQDMKFPDAPQALKMACGENPKRVYGEKGVAPSTRMGNVAGYRAAWAKAVEYRDAQAAFAAGEREAPPERDLALDTLVAVLDGRILVHNHCYRAEEMAIMLDVAREFGYVITAFHHAVEAYKVADLLAESGVCSAMWADWWGSKLELFDGVDQNVSLVHAAGACAIVHSDSAIGIQRLNQEAAKAMAAGWRAGIEVTPGEAISWITSNAAHALGIDDRVGSIEVGKAADVVVWSGDPLSVYTRADLVFVDGYRYFDRSDPARQPVMDFDLEQTVRGTR